MKKIIALTLGVILFCAATTKVAIAQISWSEPMSCKNANCSKGEDLWTLASTAIVNHKWVQLFAFRRTNGTGKLMLYPSPGDEFRQIIDLSSGSSYFEIPECGPNGCTWSKSSKSFENLRSRAGVEELIKALKRVKGFEKAY